MLDDVEPFRDWVKREDPSDAASAVAAEFIGRISDEPWAAPSIPYDGMAGRPVYEVRFVALPVPGEPDVRIRYRHTYASGHVDLIHITNRRM